MRDLTKLLHPFPAKWVKDNPSGYGSYVAHPVVQQRLMDVLGSVDTTMVELLHGRLKGEGADKPPVVVGVVLRMTATIDGRTVTVEEVGDCESPGNWPHDGARAKDAFSDAYKRCAMRLGVGLHLWAQDAFYLSEKMLKQDEVSASDAAPEPQAVQS